MTKLIPALLPAICWLVACHSAADRNAMISRQLLQQNWQDTSVHPRVDSVSVISIQPISMQRTIQELVADAGRKIAADKERSELHKRSLWNCMTNRSSIATANTATCADWLRHDSLTLQADTHYRDSLLALPTDAAKKDHYLILARMATTATQGTTFTNQWLYTDARYRVWVTRRAQ